MAMSCFSWQKNRRFYKLKNCNGNWPFAFRKRVFANGAAPFLMGNEPALIRKNASHI
jgi:hypothetical protein